tara:strand:+ start:322 stop:2175 length:1854 start_codon:yes stop_codon:yes gene_type:complete
MKNDNNDIIIISSIDWSTQRQVVHEITEYFSKENNRVLFIENTGVRSLSLRTDILRIKNRFKSWFKSSKGFTNKNSNLTIYTPIFFPFFIYSKITLWINSFVITNLVMYWLKYKKFKSPIVVSFLSTPLAQNLIKNINPQYTIFYCIDNMSDSSKSARKLKEWENIFFKNSDLVMSTSRDIYLKSKKLNSNVLYAPSGVDYKKFNQVLIDDKIKRPQDLPAGKPIVGFIGGIRKILDKELILKICDNFKNANVVLIGPLYDDFKIAKKDNLFLIKQKSHTEIPIYLKFFDACIIPYIKNEFTNGIYPTKINEYLAMGKQVISTNIKEVENFNEEHSGIIKISKNHEEFLDNVKETLSLDINKNFNLSIRIAEKNSWKNRFNRISEVFNENLYKIQKDDGWSNYIQDYLKNIRIKLFKYTLAIFIVLGIVFKSPLFYFIEKNLYVHDDIVSYNNYDAIIVFSGHGSTDFFNLDYRGRYNDLRYHIKDNKNLDIYIYGRSRILKDSEIIRSLLVQNDNISNNRIFTLETKMKNTFENVRVFRKLLLKNNVKNVIFVTAPVHSKRLKMIWEKNVKDIDISISKTRDRYYEDLQWGISFERFKITLYEYAAIAYNFFRGWL